MTVGSLGRRIAVAVVLAGSIGVLLAPVPVAAATNCATDYLPAPPSNDDKANAGFLGNAVYLESGVTCWATKEVGEAAHAGQPAAKSVWLDFKTLQGYTARIDILTAGSDFDTRLAVYQKQDGLLVAQNDDASASNRTSKVSFLRQPPGSTISIEYRIAIDGYTNASSQTADGTYIVSWQMPLVAFTSTTHLTRAIASLYLGRTPTAAEYSETVGRYSNGHDHQPGRIAADLADDGVAEAMPVARLYTAVFDRLPDPGGLEYWLAKRRAGTTLGKIAASMTASNEFNNTYGSLSNVNFVKLVYQNVLKRAPDSGGLSYWVTKLDGGFKRSELMAQFSESNEFVTKSNRLMRAAIIWRLGHGSKTDAQIAAMAAARFYDIDYFGLLLEDAAFKAFVASR